MSQTPIKQRNIRIRVERNILHTQILDHLRRHLAELKLHNTVVLAVRQEERSLLVRESLGDNVLDAVAKQQVARQSKDTAQLLLARQTAEYRHSTTLREPAQHDARGLNALIHLLFDKGVEVFARTEDTGFILSAE